MGFANESSGPLPRKHFKKVPPIWSRAFRAGKPGVSRREAGRFAPGSQAFRTGKPSVSRRETKTGLRLEAHPPEGERKSIIPFVFLLNNV